MVLPATAQNSTQQNPIDPIVNFCSRFQHRSTVKNDVLYVDGGIQTFRLGGLNYSQNGTEVPSQLGVNNYLITTDVSQSWNWWTNITQKVLEKAVNPTADYTPEKGIIRGAMFAGGADDNRIFTFGGASFMENSSFPGWTRLQSDATPLWSYNTADQVWTPFSSVLDEEPNYGAWAEAHDLGMGFYLNGQVDRGSKFAADWMGNKTFNLEGMVVVNLGTQAMTNISTPGLPNSYPRVGGSMVYLPNVGRKGVLVSLGGAYRENGGLGEFNEQKLAALDSVEIFDVASYLDNPTSNGTWYTQAASGEVPPRLIDSCVVALSAPDMSSHNIYLYGGRDPMDPSIKLYDGIWALSLPSFTWSKITGGDSPRWGHSCHVVGNRQLLTVGGSLNRTYDNCDWEQRGVAIFDLSTMIWGSVFAADAPAYNVSQTIVSTIGGSGAGGATLVTPSGGFSSRELESVMNSRRQTTKSGLSRGAIAGIVVGSCVSVALVLAAGYMLWRRRKKSQQPSGDSAIELAGAEKAEFSGESKTMEMSGVDTKFEMPAESPRAELPEEAHIAYEMPADHEVKLKQQEDEIPEVAEPGSEREFPNWAEVTDSKEQPGGGVQKPVTVAEEKKAPGKVMWDGDRPE